jgi:hypothetical protein
MLAVVVCSFVREISSLAERLLDSIEAFLLYGFRNVVSAARTLQSLPSQSRHSDQGHTTTWMNSRCTWPWIWRHYEPSKHREPVGLPDRFTSQRTTSFSYAAVTAQNSICTCRKDKKKWAKVQRPRFWPRFFKESLALKMFYDWCWSRLIPKRIIYTDLNS